MRVAQISMLHQTGFVPNPGRWKVEDCDSAEARLWQLPDLGHGPTCLKRFSSDLDLATNELESRFMVGMGKHWYPHLIAPPP
jgi:hypothetical protein